jgi:hypothetical protein
LWSSRGARLYSGRAKKNNSQDKNQGEGTANEPDAET